MAAHRDRAERDALVQDQLNERRSLQRELNQVRALNHVEVADILRNAAHVNVPFPTLDVTVDQAAAQVPPTRPRKRQGPAP